jgi:hypothetical protein
MIKELTSIEAVIDACSVIEDDSASADERYAAEWIVFNFKSKTPRIVPKDIVSVLLNYIQRKQQQDRYGK